MHRTAPTGLALVFLATPALSQVTLTPIGEGAVEDVDPSGVHVAGRSNAGGGFLWNPISGTTLLAGDDAVGVDTTGTRGFGNLDDPISTLGTAGVWTLGSGWSTLLGLPGDLGCSGTLSSAYGWSNDGSVATGLAWEGCKGRGFAWTPSGGMVALQMTDNEAARGNTVAGDGETIGGWDRAPNGTQRAAIWEANDGGSWGPPQLILAGTPGNLSGAGDVLGFSTDGTYVVGDSGNRAFMYTAADGVMLFDKFVGGNFSEARGISDDGLTVAGWEGGSGPFGAAPEAWVWRKGCGVEKVADILGHYGVPLPAYDLQRSMDVSADGLTVVGHGLLQPGLFANTGWMLKLPPSPWLHLGGGTTGANGVPNLTGQGSLEAGAAGNLHLEDAAPSTVAALAVSVASTPIPIFGGTLHAFPLALTQTLSTSPDGTVDLPFNWPPLAVSGNTITFQVAVIDFTAPFSIVLSNGLGGTTF